MTWVFLIQLPKWSFQINHLGSISQKVVSLRLIVSVIVSVISKLLIGWNSHLRLILDLQLFVKSTWSPNNLWKKVEFSHYLWSIILVIYRNQIFVYVYAYTMENITWNIDWNQFIKSKIHSRIWSRFTEIKQSFNESNKTVLIVM